MREKRHHPGTDVPPLLAKEGSLWRA